MTEKLNRRQVILGGAAVVAGAACPLPAVVPVVEWVSLHNGLSVCTLEELRADVLRHIAAAYRIPERYLTGDVK